MQYTVAARYIQKTPKRHISTATLFFGSGLLVTILLTLATILFSFGAVAMHTVRVANAPLPPLPTAASPVLNLGGVPISETSPLMPLARRLLALPLTINAYSPITNKTETWTLAADQWGEWLRVENTANGASLNVDPALLTNYLNGQNLQLGESRYIDPVKSTAAIRAAVGAGSTTANIRVYSSPTLYTVQGGDTLGAIAWKQGIPMWRISNANPGVNMNALSTGQRITLPSKDDLLPLPIVDGKRIVISIAKQHMWVYENSQLKWDWVASTGISSSPTMPGLFQVQSHDKNAYGSLWDLWMPHFMGIYEAVPGFMNGIHGLPTLSNGHLLWAGFLGRPITYGCVLLSLENAATLYSWATDGVVVEIQA